MRLPASPSFVDETPPSSAPTSSATEKHLYIGQLRSMREHNLGTLYVDYQHLMTTNDGILASAIANSFLRFLPYLTRGLHDVIAKYEPKYFRAHRQPHSSSSHADTSVNGNAASQSDNHGEKTTHQQNDKFFSLAIYDLPLVSRVRQLRTDSIGKLVSISGTVTRTSEVRPELYLATFTCAACNSVVPNVEQASLLGSIHWLPLTGVSLDLSLY